MSKKLMSEIEKTLREVRINLEQYDEKWMELREFNKTQQGVKEKYWEEGRKEQMRGKKHAVRTATLELMDFKHVCDTKAKIENEMEAILRKLHRLRQQIIEWIGNLDLRSKDDLVDIRKQIELRYKRGKSFYKQGLCSDITENSVALKDEATQSWLSDYVQRLSEQVDHFESEIEACKGSGGKASRAKIPAAHRERIDQLKAFVELHKMHISKLEGILRQIRNKTLFLEDSKLEELKDVLQPYVENNEDLMIVVAEDAYPELGLTEDFPTGEAETTSTPPQSPHVTTAPSGEQPGTRRPTTTSPSVVLPAGAVQHPAASDKPEAREDSQAEPAPQAATQQDSNSPRLIHGPWNQHNASSSNARDLQTESSQTRTATGGTSSMRRSASSDQMKYKTVSSPAGDTSTCKTASTAASSTGSPPSFKLATSAGLPNLPQNASQRSHHATPGGGYAQHSFTQAQPKAEALHSRWRPVGTAPSVQGTAPNVQHPGTSDASDASRDSYMTANDQTSSTTEPEEQQQQPLRSESVPSPSNSQATTRLLYPGNCVIAVDEIGTSWEPDRLDSHQLKVVESDKVNILTRHESGWTYGYIMREGPDGVEERHGGWFPNHTCASEKHKRNIDVESAPQSDSADVRGAQIPAWIASRDTYSSTAYPDPNVAARVSRSRPASEQRPEDRRGPLLPATVQHSGDHRSSRMQSQQPLSLFSAGDPVVKDRQRHRPSAGIIGQGRIETNGTRRRTDEDAGSLVHEATDPRWPRPSADMAGSTVVHVLTDEVEIRQLHWTWRGELANPEGTKLLYFDKGEKVELLVHHVAGWIFGRIRGEPKRQGWFPEYMVEPPEVVFKAAGSLEDPSCIRPAQTGDGIMMFPCNSV